MGDDAERVAKWTVFRITGMHDLKAHVEGEVGA